jgi:hypothetical protein
MKETLTWVCVFELVCNKTYKWKLANRVLQIFSKCPKKSETRHDIVVG